MELIEFKLKEETKTHYLFELTILEKYGFFNGKTREIKLDCSKEKPSRLAIRIDTGEMLIHDYSGLDDSINTILSSKTKSYKKGLFI